MEHNDIVLQSIALDLQGKGLKCSFVSKSLRPFVLVQSKNNTRSITLHVRDNELSVFETINAAEMRDVTKELIRSIELNNPTELDCLLNGLADSMR